MIRSIICAVLLSFFSLDTHAQRVGDAKDSASDHKSGGSGLDRPSSSRGGSRGGYAPSGHFFVDIMGQVMFMVFMEVQRERLRLAQDDDWRVSLEANALTGVDVGNLEFFNSQTIRGNWGLFSTQVRRFDINDVTGRFTTIDWQVVQFNLVNREAFRWLFGVGISHEVEVNQTHPEFSTEVQFSLFDKKLKPAVTYRSSGDGYPRTELSALMTYRPFRMNKAELTINAGYIFQRLYGIPFNFPSIGLGFYLK